MQYKTLNDGNKIPVLGYGVCSIPDCDCDGWVIRAVECGYRHFDTAQIYGNESGVGRAIENCGVAREELFITSKVWVKEYGFDKTLRSIVESLKKLKTDYVDLMLLHRPFFDYKSSWKALEKAQKDGLVKSIGISNFNEKQTEDILSVANTVPAVNQIELHPYFGRKNLKEFLKNKNIEVEAWFPLGNGNKKLLNDKVICSIAKKYSKTPSQIILRWHIENGNIIFPKTRNLQHMNDNFDIFSFSLEECDIKAIDGLDKNKKLFLSPDWFQKLTIKLQG